jgi:hypothetical protein
MKFLSLMFLPLMLFSCSKEESRELISPTSETSYHISKAEIENILFNQEEITPEKFMVRFDSLKSLYDIDIFFDDFEKEDDVKDVELRNIMVVLDNMRYPHIAYGGEIELFQNNINVLLTAGNLAGVGTGIYVCDVYKVIKTVSLPSGNTGVTTESPNCGYADASAQIRGVASFYQISTDFTMTSYVIHVKYNLIGQTYNKWDPCKPENVQFRYVYGNILWF